MGTALSFPRESKFPLLWRSDPVRRAVAVVIAPAHCVDEFNVHAVVIKEPWTIAAVLLVFVGDPSVGRCVGGLDAAAMRVLQK